VHKVKAQGSGELFVKKVLFAASLCNAGLGRMWL